MTAFGEILKFAQFGGPLAALGAASVIWDRNPWIGGVAVGYGFLWLIVNALLLVRTARFHFAQLKRGK